MGWTVRGSKPGGGKTFSFLQHVWTVSGATQHCMQWVLGLFPGGKRPGRGVDHSPLTRVEVKYEWSCPFTSTICLNVVDWDNFACYLFVFIGD
jgi:hypothetical protein